MASSAVARLARSSWAGAKDGWRGAPRGAPAAFAARLLAATVLAVLASVGSALALGALAADGRLPGDARVDAWVDGGLSVHSALWLGALTSSAMVIPIVAVAAVLWARAGRWERAALAPAAFVASKAIILAGWLTWARPRPADVGGGEIVPASMSSYPSGHSVQALTIYGLLALWWVSASDRWWERGLAWALVGAVALAVGAGRIRIGAHHPSDVAGGILLGALWLVGAAWAERAARPI